MPQFLVESSWVLQQFITTHRNIRSSQRFLWVHASLRGFKPLHGSQRPENQAIWWSLWNSNKSHCTFRLSTRIVPQPVGYVLVPSTPQSLQAAPQRSRIWDQQKQSQPPQRSWAKLHLQEHLPLGVFNKKPRVHPAFGKPGQKHHLDFDGLMGNLWKLQEFCRDKSWGV